MDILLHRVYMISVLPFTIIIAILSGPFLGLEIVYEKFIEHWNK